MVLRLRKCGLNDIRKLQEIAKTTFIEAFEKHNNPEDFESYVALAFAEQKIRKELLGPDSHFYFVYRDNLLVGYFKLNYARAQNEFKNRNSIELERIYVLQKFQGGKIGTWILHEVLKISASEQKEFVWLGVWQKNTKAVAFYEKHGFEKVGTHPYFIGNDKQTDWLMRYSIAH